MSRHHLSARALRRRLPAIRPAGGHLFNVVTII